MSELTTVARPYAKAAFEFAVEQDALDKWSEMLAFASAVATDATVQKILAGPESAEKKSEMFLAVCGEQLDQHGQNLIKVMAENNRLLALAEVSAFYEIHKAEHVKLIEVTVSSASELTVAEQNKISQAMEQRLARKVHLNCLIDPTLVAGVVIKAGDLVIDGSVRGKLDRLADVLQS
jgi:F-type H+-transporting ATPase subunit delta